MRDEKQSALKALIDQFYKALRNRNFNLLETTIVDLCEMETFVPEAQAWATYFSGILAGERERNWATAENIYQALLSSEVTPVLRAHILLSLGVTYYQQARWLDSVTLCQESAALWKHLNYPYKLAVVLRQLAVSYQMGFEGGAFEPTALDKATAYCNQALQLLASPPTETPDVLLYESDLLLYQAYTWDTFGGIHCAAGRWAEAIASYQKFLNISIERNDQFHASFAFLGLANAHQQRDATDWPQAHIHYANALTGFRAYQDPYNELIVLASQGVLYLKQKAYSAALACFDQSLALIEAVRAGISTPEARRGFFATVVHIYANTVLTHLALGQVAQAFETTERARARAFLDSLFIDETDFSNRVEAAPLTLAAIQSKLPADAILLAYFTTGLYEPHGGRVTLPQAQRAVLFPSPATLLFAITKATIDCFDLGMMPNQLYPQEQSDWVAGNFLQLHMRKALYRILLHPVEKLLAKPRRIYVIPHGPLHYVPFQALLTAAQEDWQPDGSTLVYAPSASGLLTQRHSRPRPARLPCLTIGCNDSGARTLYLAEAEAQYIADLLHGRTLNGDEPKTWQLHQVMAETQIIHFACHGEFNLNSPLRSALHIAKGEVLTGQTILQSFKLHCDLVTLSACESGINRVQQGDELYGLPRAFLLAGATAVLAALWRVDERPTLLLMVKFYELLQQGIAYAEALKRAQQYLKTVSLPAARQTLQHVLGSQKVDYLAEFDHRAEEAPFAAPQYWAAFTLIGDPDL